MTEKVENQIVHPEINDEMIKLESIKIMNRVYEYETTKKKVIPYKSLIGIAAILLLALVPLFNQDESSIGIKQISANEYRLNIFGDSIYFRVFGLVENPNKIKMSEDYGTYEGFQKYFDITSKLKVELIEINDYLFLEVSNKDEVLEYLYVKNYDDHNRNVMPVDREFEDFKSEMTKITELVDRFPFEYVVSNDICYNEVVNTGINVLSEREQADYEWFKNLQGGLCSSDPITEYEFIMYFDGTVQDIGRYVNSLHRSGGKYDVTEDDFPVYFMPEDNYLENWSGIEEDEVSALLYTFYNSDDEFGEFAVAARIDLDKYKLDDIEIKITVNNEELSDFTYVQSDKYVYVMPTFLEPNIVHSKSSDVKDGESGNMITRKVESEIEIIHAITKRHLYSSSDGMEYTRALDE